MKKVFILGSGFSKAVAGLPLTKEMMVKFGEILKDEKQLGHDLRVEWGKKIFEFWGELEKQFLRVPLGKGKNSVNISESNYWTNFESILTFIDLNLSNEVKANLTENNETHPLIGGKPMFWNRASYYLDEIRDYIATYLFLALIEDKINTGLIKLFSNKMLNKGDIIISFNYDLALEKYLFKEKIWFPKDGYGINFDLMPEIKDDYQIPSQIKILKLHGSLNWEKGFKLRWADDFNKSFFPNYLINEPKYPVNYEGKHGSEGWILPSWIKIFVNPQFNVIWKLASQALNLADEIIVIGYSLPPEDSSVVALMSTINYHCQRILLIDPCASDLVDKYRKITQMKSITIFENTFEDYLNKSMI